MLKVKDAPYQLATNPFLCRGTELRTPAGPEHTATGNRSKWAVYDDADPLTWWPLCERCAQALGYPW